MAQRIVEGLTDLTHIPWVPHLVMYDGATVGTAGYHGPPTAGVAIIGYGIVESHRGRDIATSAVLQLIEKARVAGGAHRIDATTALDNVASQRVLAKCGFTRREDRTSDQGPEQCWFLELR